MATKTFTQLTAVTTLAAGDELVQWNASAGAARKITVANFIANSPNGGLAELGTANTFTAPQTFNTSATNTGIKIYGQSGHNPIVDLEAASFTPVIRVYSSGSGIIPRFSYGNGAGAGGLTFQRITTGGGIGGSVTEVMRLSDSNQLLVGTTTEAGKITCNGEIALVDGMTAPATTSGWAKLYVDSADGDLKIKFGDGTVKTIVVDT